MDAASLAAAGALWVRLVVDNEASVVTGLHLAPLLAQKP
jgi:hypothetical protein